MRASSAGVMPTHVQWPRVAEDDGKKGIIPVYGNTRATRVSRAVHLTRIECDRVTVR